PLSGENVRRRGRGNTRREGVSGPLRGGGTAAAAGATTAARTTAAAGPATAARSASSARATAATAGAATCARTALVSAVLRQRLHGEGPFQRVALLFAAARGTARAARTATLLVLAELLLHRLGHEVHDVLELADLLRRGHRLFGREDAHQPDAPGLVPDCLERLAQPFEPLAGGARRLRHGVVEELLRFLGLRLLRVRAGRRPLLRLRILGGRPVLRLPFEILADDLLLLAERDVGILVRVPVAGRLGLARAELVGLGLRARRDVAHGGLGELVVRGVGRAGAAVLRERLVPVFVRLGCR